MNRKNAYPDLGGQIDTAYLASKGYTLVNNEYVRTASLLTSEAIAEIVEKNIVPFFKGIGFEVNRVPRGLTKTVDYECGDVGLEVTALQDYLPKCNEVDKILKRHRETNSIICAYMYLKADKPKIEILDEQKLNNNTSILCLRQHISCYRPKLSNSLAGVLMSIPKGLDVEMSNEPDYIFVRNPYCGKQHELISKLKDFSLATTSDWLTILHMFVKFSGCTSITSPCLDCPEKEELAARKMPTFMMNPI